MRAVGLAQIPYGYGQAVVVVIRTYHMTCGGLAGRVEAPGIVRTGFEAGSFLTEGIVYFVRRYLMKEHILPGAPLVSSRVEEIEGTVHVGIEEIEKLLDERVAGDLPGLPGKPTHPKSILRITCYSAHPLSLWLHPKRSATSPRKWD